MHLASLNLPFSINFEVTNICDLDCIFCSARLNEGKKNDLNTNNIYYILKELSFKGIKSLFITGGDPFNRDDIVEIIGYAINLGINVTLSTNGIRITHDIARKLYDAGLEEIQVSIHGTEKIHDKIVKVNGAYDMAIKGLKALCDAGLRVTVASVLTKLNINNIPNLVYNISEIGAHYFRVQRLMPHSSYLLSQVVSSEDMMALTKKLRIIESELKNIIIRIHSSPGLWDYVNWCPEEYDIVHPLCNTCTAAKLSMGILSNGDCLPCLELRGAEFISGNILNDDINTIWSSSPMRLLRNTIPDNYKGKCGDCDYKWSCYSARCVSYNLSGDIMGDDISCYRIIDRKI